MPEFIDKYSGWGRPGKVAPPASAPPPQTEAREDMATKQAGHVLTDRQVEEIAKTLEDANTRSEMDKSVIEKLLAENAELQRRIAEADQKTPLPPAPGTLEQTPIQEIMAAADNPAPSTDDVATLQARARELGINVDPRWGYKKLAREIAAAEDDGN